MVSLLKVKKVLRVLARGARYLPQSTIRRCGCCGKITVIVSLSPGGERKLCLRCRANIRYEMLGTYLRTFQGALPKMAVLELDSRSPLRPLLSKAGKYERSYYSAHDALGSVSGDGARCEDITRLTYPDESLDLMVSSDVLEHVPDVIAAFRESCRVLRPGGSHVFTVPTTQTETLKRAEIVDNQLRHLTEPEYHSDPLDPTGILAFWTFGMDAPAYFGSSGLQFTIPVGPEEKEQRVIWKATKPLPNNANDRREQ